MFGILDIQYSNAFLVDSYLSTHIFPHDLRWLDGRRPEAIGYDSNNPKIVELLAQYEHEKREKFGEEEEEEEEEEEVQKTTRGTKRQPGRSRQLEKKEKVPEWKKSVLKQQRAVEREAERQREKQRLLRARRHNNSDSDDEEDSHEGRRGVSVRRKGAAGHGGGKHTKHDQKKGKGSSVTDATGAGRQKGKEHKEHDGNDGDGSSGEHARSGDGGSDSVAPTAGVRQPWFNSKRKARWAMTHEASALQTARSST